MYAIILLSISPIDSSKLILIIKLCFLSKIYIILLHRIKIYSPYSLENWDIEILKKSSVYWFKFSENWIKWEGSSFWNCSSKKCIPFWETSTILLSNKTIVVEYIILSKYTFSLLTMSQRFTNNERKSKKYFFIIANINF